MDAFEKKFCTGHNIYDGSVELHITCYYAEYDFTREADTLWGNREMLIAFSRPHSSCDWWCQTQDSNAIGVCIAFLFEIPVKEEEEEAA